MAVRRLPVRGELDLATAQDLHATLSPLVTSTTDDLILDAAGLTFIDSTGIGVLVHFHRALELQGRELRIENMKRRVRRPLDILGLTELFGSRELDPA